MNESDLNMVSLKDAMRKVAATVGVVSTRHDNSPMAMTATSFCSVTLEPASILVCVNHSASMHGALKLGAAFCMNLLSEGQNDVSAACGGHVHPQERFNIGDWRFAHDGVPYLCSAQANIFCKVAQIIDCGTHSIVIGSVCDVKVIQDVAPLVYCDGDYVKLAAVA